MSKKLQPHIFITNDDGPHSHALEALIKKLQHDYKLTVVVPDRPRSGISKAVTFDAPLRFFTGKNIAGHPIIETTGTPANAIVWCRTHSPDVALVVVGPNLGMNVSLHSMLTSGTVGAAFEAALWGIPAIAFSIETPSESWFNPSDKDANVVEAARRTHAIVNHVIQQGLPPGVDLLNVNYPQGLDKSTPTKVAKSTPIRFLNRFIKRKDPQGVEYHWIAGKPVRNISSTSDVYIATKDYQVVISPIGLMKIVDDGLIESTQNHFLPLFR